MLKIDGVVLAASRWAAAFRVAVPSPTRAVQLLEAVTELESAYMRLAEKHIEMFERRLRPPIMARVREDECIRYLAIWKSIRDKKGSVAALTAEEQQEISEATYSGDYDDTLTAKEPTSPA